ncbi:PQQ-dependent sugar dehydrogenase [Reinekea marina]|uniref:PQQ-dependent sugar dehydrogenase n=1 Tax=Reinekea marina TaxID=1310421 RepID=A0ABV7WSX5_9GAMM
MKRLMLLCLSLVSWNCIAQPTVAFERAFGGLQFNQPILITHANDGRNQLFVVEQGGRVLAFDNDPSVKQASVFFDLSKSTTNQISTGGEEGLLGLAFDPDYAANGHFYVYYSAKSPRRSVISRFTATFDNNADMPQEQSEQVLLEIQQPYSNHNGGMLSFGPDHQLYIATGDGGSAGDPKNVAQNLNSPLGKILRVDTSGQASKDNPFINTPNADPRVWAYGLRNPWRMSFDTKTGQLWLGDVGQNAWEEVNVIEKGGNYGWRLFEGTHEFKPEKDAQLNLLEPVFEYNHRDGQSITGGVVYRGSDYPQLQGWYLFADFVSGQIWMLDSDNPGNSAVKTGRIPNPSAFGTDEQGELYVVSYRGTIHRVSVAQP